MRIFLVIGLCWTVSMASAQDRLLSDSELNRLKIWNPVYKPQVMTGEKPYNRLPSPTEYENLAELAERMAKQETIQALRVNVAVLKNGNVEKLAGLKDLRILQLEVDSVTATAALWQAVSQLKQLQRLSVFQFVSSPAGGNFSITIPASLQRLTRLEYLGLTIGQSNWEQTFSTLAGMPGLRKLIFMGNGKQMPLPPELGKLRQLTSLTIRSGPRPVQLPSALGELTKLKELNMTYMPVDQNADWTFLSKLTELEVLGLAGSNLRSLPDLRKLKKIRSVDLQGNQQLTIPDETFNGLDSLEHLNLTSCQLRQFPMAITRLSALKKLMMFGNPLGELPAELGSLQHLEELFVSQCQLRKLPASLGNLTHLRTLELAGNQLDTLGFDLNKLTGITHLSLDNNQLRYLPASLGQLTRLTRLSVSNNKLAQLPETIGNLENLTDLELRMNQLTALPGGIDRLTKLTRLDVTQNQLQYLPAGIGQLRRLKQLTLGSNKLTLLPEELSKLDSLSWIDLSNNQLTALPISLFGLSRLEGLFLSENKLVEMPSALGKLSNLKYLSLVSNRLARLPSELGKLTKLQTISVGGNPLEAMPETIQHCRELTNLNARNTKIKVLPDGIMQLTKLQDLDLSGNELTILPAALGNLTQLRSLRLGRTRLLALPESIGRLTKLAFLQIGEMENGAVTEQAGLRQLPDSIIYCQEIMDLQLMNQSGLDGEDAFVKISKLRKLRNLTLFHCNLERLPAIDWKSFTIQQLSLMSNRLTELPVELLESPRLQQIALYDNLLPQPLNVNFGSKDALRLAFSEAGLLALDKIAKPNRGIAASYVQAAFQKASQRNWTEAFANFEKAIDYASDTMRLVLYAQRADMHLFRNEYPEALADYDQSLLLANRLSQGISPQHPLYQQFNQPAVMALRGRATTKAKLGQIEAASSDIELALQKIPAIKDDPMLKGSLVIEQGRYLALKNKVQEANTSYQKAIEEYGKLTFANTGIKLTVVELHIISGQPDQARKALQQIDRRELSQGYLTLEKYLENSIQVLKGEKPAAEVLEDLRSYLTSHSEQIIGWSFELYENWLSHSDLSPEKRTILQQMTQLTKERVPKMN